MGGTALGGALRRGPDGAWYWADGTPEPRVTDLRMSDWYRFPTREENGETFVEVPVEQANADHQLQWILYRHYRIDQSESAPADSAFAAPSLFGGAPRSQEVYLVPHGDWEEVELEQVDARWDQCHQDEIIARAREVNELIDRVKKSRRAS